MSREATESKTPEVKESPEQLSQKNPQDTLTEFWDKLITKKPSQVTNIFPPSFYTNLPPRKQKASLAKGKNAAESYHAAASECRALVKRIVRECHRMNEKVTVSYGKIMNIY
jgi:hypothetical protein